jgi:hypothetical protein
MKPISVKPNPYNEEMTTYEFAVGKDVFQIVLQRVKGDVAAILEFLDKGGGMIPCEEGYDEQEEWAYTLFQYRKGEHAHVSCARELGGYVLRISMWNLPEGDDVFDGTIDRTIMPPTQWLDALQVIRAILAQPPVEVVK